MSARGCRASSATPLQLEELEEEGGQASPRSPGVPRGSVEDLRELRGARVPMAVSVSVLIYECIAYNAVFLQRVLPAVGKSMFVMPFLVVFNFFWGLAMWSYIRAHCTDPGSVPKRWQEFVLSVGDALPIAPARSEWQPGKATYCQKCRVPRPERAHHCVICGMCVLRMDHHCPWINNCVGFHNHKFFLLVGIYCCIASLLALVTTFPELILCAAIILHLDGFLSSEARDVMMVDVVVLLVFGFLALLFFTLLTPMIASHMPLARRNLTTIENNYDNMPNPFDHGSTFANLAQVFGAFGLDWFFPVSPWRPLCDGVSFPRVDESLGPDGVPDLPDSLVGDEDEPETEKVWRLRYNVRLNTTPTTEKKPISGPLPFFTRWWSGSTTDTRRIISL
eukprot:CAMPEP_0179068440 /NCGR_PEP_ID=MMETSP0796-20121207/30003_1 /TAXON_ID=73915 /ORGANISM="Pyrodinium bahamense, Strain pbaha01" /LENGTH=392 /DNA_ID=CAMNT_0020765495 /DNA_START=1 /DNA_END=1179 /DNA_ORIENTATION=+